MPASSKPHPIRAVLRSQGKSITWLAERLECRPQTLYDRLSGHRRGNAKRGPRAWQPKAVLVVAAAEELGIGTVRLAEWLSGLNDPPADGGAA